MIKVTKYSATWCGPCQALKPIFDEIKREHTNVMFEEVDVDQNRTNATENKVTSVPTVIIFKNGQEVNRFTGVRPKNAISNLINQYK